MGGAFGEGLLRCLRPIGEEGMTVDVGKPVEKGNTCPPCRGIGSGMTEGEIGQGGGMVSPQRGQMIFQGGVAKFFPWMEVGIAGYSLVKDNLEQGSLPWT